MRSPIRKDLLAMLRFKYARIPGICSKLGVDNVTLVAVRGPEAVILGMKKK